MGEEMLVWHNGEVIGTKLVAKQQVKVWCDKSNVCVIVLSEHNRHDKHHNNQYH